MKNHRLPGARPSGRLALTPGPVTVSATPPAMMLPRFRFLSPALAVLRLSWVAVVVTASAWATSFTDTLSATERDAAGLQKLEPEQLAALNEHIERELTLARDGNVRAFAGSFSRRRNDDDRARSGLNLLTPVEIALIDAHVAQRMARPSFVSWPARKRADGEAETVSNRPEIHGSVSLFYGTGGGGSYRGGAMTMTYDDPARNLSISVTYSEVHGNGGSGRYVTRGGLPTLR